MAVSIEQIKELRESTGVSMMACKKALEEADGDYDKAVELLRKKGEAKAADRASRGTSNGAVFVKVADDKAAMVKLLCETDFVSRGDDFLAIGEDLVSQLFAGEISPDTTEVDSVKEAVLKLGENIQIGGMALMEDGTLGTYVHSNKRIGVIVSLNGGTEEIAKELAMHIAATDPKVISPDEVSDDLVESEKGVWIEQLRAEGKPDEIVEKILIGKEKKFREESALIKQPFVKDPEMTIEQLLGDASVFGFVRFAV